MVTLEWPLTQNKETIFHCLLQNIIIFYKKLSLGSTEAWEIKYRIR